MSERKTFADFGIEVPSGSSAERYTTCPNCSHQRKKKRAKCLGVNVEEEVWVCHHCSWAGSLKNGVERNTELHWRRPTYRKPAPEKLPKADLPDQVRKWFADRGISDQTLIDYGVGYGSVYMPQVEEWVNAISFPYYRDGELVNIKWRDGQKHFRMEAGAERILFGLDDIDPSYPVIWVEGEADKLSFYEAGVKNVVSVPDGAPAPEADNYDSKFTFLGSVLDRWPDDTWHMLAVDNDKAGQKLNDELSRRLGREKCLEITWPEGCKDANDTLKAHGPGALQEAIGNAKPYPVSGIHTVADCHQKLWRIYNEGRAKGESTGWECLDKYYTVRTGEWTVVTGVPNSGKSNVVDALAVNMAKANGWKFAVFSPENQPIEDHISRMVEKYAGMPFDRGPSMRIDQRNLELSEQFLHDHFYWILPDDEEPWTVNTVLAKAKTVITRYGVNGVIIDPWNELEHEFGKDETETQYISRSLSDIRKFARNMGVHVWVVAHPTKLQKKSDGTYPVPTLYDIAGSAHWRNKADNGLVVVRHFDDDSKPIDVHTQKIRFREIGRLGMAQLHFDPKSGHYHEHPPFSSYARAS